MLTRLSSSLAGFKSGDFAAGLNVAVAIRSRTSRAKDSRNAVGKSSLIAVLDFLLGSDAGPQHVVRHPMLTDASFTLGIETGSGPVAATRSGASSSELTLDRRITSHAEELFRVVDADETVTVGEWRDWLGHEPGTRQGREMRL